MDRSRFARAAAALPLLACAACVSVVEPAPDEGLAATAAYEALAPDSPPSDGAFVGLELAESVAGSLDAMEFLRGLRVLTVVAGSPAEIAGLHAGDVVVKVNGIELARLDQWTALLRAARPDDSWRLDLERKGALATASLRVLQRAATGVLHDDRFIERRRLGCVARTVAHATSTVARIEEIDPHGALHAAGVGVGALVIALDGVDIDGAADLFTRISTREPGARVTLRVVRDGGAARDVPVTLPEAERHLTAITLWPLFGWSESPDETRGELVLVDLWLIWLFKRTHEGAACTTSILRFISWESGVGSLTDETVPSVGGGA